MKIFNVDPKHLHTDDFFFYLADIYTIGVQYGRRTQLCDMLMGNAMQKTDDQLAAVANFGLESRLDYYQYYSTSLRNTTIDFDKSSRQWTY